MSYDNPESWKQNKESSGYIQGHAPKKRWRKFYEDNKETILWTGIVILAIKNHNLAVDLRVANKQLRESKEFIDKAKVQLEALSLFDQYFGPRKLPLHKP